MGRKIGVLIRQERKKRGLQQRILASWLKVSPVLINNWEKDKRYPNKECIDKLNKIFNTDIFKYKEGGIVYKSKQCKECTKTFKPIGANQRYCSALCRK